MKKVFLFVALVLSISVNAQYFNGILLDGDLPSFTAKMKAKGFTLKEIFENKNGASYTGTMAGYAIEVYAFLTPKTKKVYGVDVYFETATTWAGLKNRYERFVEIFKEKYGEPYGNIEKFEKPYYEGDGYELQAVKLEKINFTTLWKETQGLNLIVKISKFKQVQLSYNNKVNYELAVKEDNQMESVAF